MPHNTQWMKTSSRQALKFGEGQCMSVKSMRGRIMIGYKAQCRRGSSTFSTFTPRSMPSGVVSPSFYASIIPLIVLQVTMPKLVGVPPSEV